VSEQDRSEERKRKWDQVKVAFEKVDGGHEKWGRKEQDWKEIGHSEGETRGTEPE